MRPLPPLVPALVAGMAVLSLAACGGRLGHDAPGETAQAPALPDTPAPPVAASVRRPTLDEAQAMLRARGVDPGPIDGQWGPRTAQAVQQFQRDQGLETTGELDDATLAALGFRLGAPAAAGAAATGASAPLSPFERADRDRDGLLNPGEFLDAVRLHQQPR